MMWSISFSSFANELEKIANGGKGKEKKSDIQITDRPSFWDRIKGKKNPKVIKQYELADDGDTKDYKFREKKSSSGLTEKQKAHMSKSTFAEPGKKDAAGQKGSYPIPDKKHARIAMGFAKMHHDAAAESAVRAKIKQKYPDMLKKS